MKTKKAKIEKTEIFVDIVGVGMARWDCFLSILHERKTDNGTNLRKWFFKHFEVKAKKVEYNVKKVRG